MLNHTCLGVFTHRVERGLRLPTCAHAPMFVSGQLSHIGGSETTKTDPEGAQSLKVRIADAKGMRTGPVCSIGLGGQNRNTKIFLSKTKELDLSGRKVSTEMTHMDMPWSSQPRRAGEQTEVLGGEMGGVTALLPPGRADRSGGTGLTVSSIIRTERVCVSPTRSFQPCPHTSFFFGTPIDFFFS